MALRVEDFDFDLPEKLIAQAPANPRDAARMLVIDRNSQTLEHKSFSDLTASLNENDVLVINQSKVFPARLKGQKETGGEVEILLLAEQLGGEWEALSKPGLTGGVQINFSDKLTAAVIEPNNEEGVLRLRFKDPKNLNQNMNRNQICKILEVIGQAPLPPYIHSTLPESKLRQEYQTVYATEWGSAAAPTAGMHFTKSSLKKLADNGVGILPVTLHVGLGTFQPVTNKQVKEGLLHTERFCITRQTAEKIQKAKLKGKRIIAVGTTSARVLESAARMEGGELTFMTDWQETNLFIKPPYKFKAVDSLITNFHLPQSSLLMLVTAMVSAPNTKLKAVNFKDSLMGEAYREAIANRYRFYSFGDCMWIK